MLLTPAVSHSHMAQPCAHNRHSVAWIIRDEQTRTLLVAQKLALAVSWINERAHSRAERVAVNGLFRAASQRDDSRTGGLHKFRYRVCRLPLDSLRAALGRPDTTGWCVVSLTPMSH